MSNIDKEWLKQKIADMEATRDEIPFGLDEDDSKTLAALRIALASLEAEPVLFVMADDLKDSSIISTPAYRDLGEAMERTVGDVVALYAAPPAPVSVPEPIKRNDADGWWMYKGRRVGGGCAEWYNRALDDCRAAMLQGAERNSPSVPDGWVMVPVEPTEKMVIEGFESEPDEFFSKSEEWEAYQEMSGCEQAAHRAKLCWAAMIASAPKPEA
ncbi:hypothetical protein [Enterobacter roggenkampii]|uniref:hypothetical protein n=1 Tax=Enterobacter roggenkampii TaxID=1812935 RepID=UPI002A808D70|nr:hypothetical protein [Enterobacter roggenkampii]